MKMRIAAVAALAGSLLLIPIAIESADAGRGGGVAVAWAAVVAVAWAAVTSVAWAASAAAISAALVV